MPSPFSYIMPRFAHRPGCRRCRRGGTGRRLARRRLRPAVDDGVARVRRIRFGTMRVEPFVFALGVAVTAIIACSGEAIVDDPDRGSGGSTTVSTAVGTTDSTAITATTGPTDCVSPTPQGSLSDGVCFGSAGPGSGGGPRTCEFGCDDAGGNTFSVACASGSCECRYNGAVICSCDNPSGNCVDHCCVGAWQQL